MLAGLRASAALLLLGCSATERTPGSHPRLSVVAEAAGMRLTNEIAEPVYFSAVAAEQAPTSTFRFTPCEDTASCAAVPAQGALLYSDSGSTQKHQTT